MVRLVGRIIGTDSEANAINVMGTWIQIHLHHFLFLLPIMQGHLLSVDLDEHTNDKKGLMIEIPLNRENHY